MVPLPPLLDRETIRERLLLGFPPGCPNRAHSTREIAARTVFVMMYAGAVEGRKTWIRPDQVTRMSDDQAAKADSGSRHTWLAESLKSSKGEIQGRWYAANTRESIRDDTIRYALIPNGAVVEREGLATTSPAPRYALSADFASLLDPKLAGEHLVSAIKQWQATSLSAGAIARIAIWRSGAVASDSSVLVRFPNEETRSMAPGQSSLISKAVIEGFAPSFLGKPAVLWLSESRNKSVARDDELAAKVGLRIQPDRNLPDIILLDLEPEHPLLVFVEVVSTDGPVTVKRKDALTKVALEAGFSSNHVGFMTAYWDRDEAAFRKTVGSLAWDTFVWFASEPKNLVQNHGDWSEHGEKISDWIR